MKIIVRLSRWLTYSKQEQAGKRNVGNFLTAEAAELSSTLL